MGLRLVVKTLLTFIIVELDEEVKVERRAPSSQRDLPTPRGGPRKKNRDDCFVIALVVLAVMLVGVRGRVIIVVVRIAVSSLVGTFFVRSPSLFAARAL